MFNLRLRSMRRVDDLRDLSNHNPKKWTLWKRKPEKRLMLPTRLAGAKVRRFGSKMEQASSCERTIKNAVVLDSLQDRPSWADRISELDPWHASKFKHYHKKIIGNPNNWQLVFIDKTYFVHVKKLVRELRLLTVNINTWHVLSRENFNQTDEIKLSHRNLIAGCEPDPLT